MSEPTLQSVMEELKAMRKDAIDVREHTITNFQRMHGLFEDLHRSVHQISVRLLTIESDISILKKEVWEIKDELRKINKFVATDHADFPH